MTTLRPQRSVESPPSSSPRDYQRILNAARELYESGPDWVTFFREILGIDGVVRRQFTRFEELRAFEKSLEFEQIQKWLVKLREQKSTIETESEPTRVITVRIPESMHEYLKSEAHDLHATMNKLCISKLLQVIEEDLVPTERRRRVNDRQLEFRHAEEKERIALRRQLSELQERLSEYDRYLATNMPK